MIGRMWKNLQVPEHEMGSSDPTQTAEHQNSNADDDRNGTCSIASVTGLL